MPEGIECMVLQPSHGPLTMRVFLRTRDRCNMRLRIVQSLPATLYHAEVHAQRARDSDEQQTQGINLQPQQEGKETPVEGHGNVNSDHGGKH